ALGAIAKPSEDGRLSKEPGEEAANHQAHDGEQQRQRHAADRLIRQPLKHGRDGADCNIRRPANNRAERNQRQQDHQAAQSGRFQKSVKGSHGTLPLPREFWGSALAVTLLTWQAVATTVWPTLHSLRPADGWHRRTVRSPAATAPGRVPFLAGASSRSSASLFDIREGFFPRSGAH